MGRNRYLIVSEKRTNHELGKTIHGQELRLKNSEAKDHTDYWEAACTMSGGNLIPSVLATS
jgi:hypothetical protein